MERLIAWLADKVPADDGRVALVHGDWRIDNMIFDHSPRLLAVLDWELSTLGHPFADLAYQCMQWRLPAGKYRGLGAVDRAANGIPTEAEYVAAYRERMGLKSIPDWTFLIAFSFFRSIAIHQGVYKRSLDGNASNPELARQLGGPCRWWPISPGSRSRPRARPCSPASALLPPARGRLAGDDRPC